MTMLQKKSLPKRLVPMLLAISFSGMLSGCGVLVAGAAGGAAGYVAGTAASDDDTKKD